VTSRSGDSARESETGTPVLNVPQQRHFEVFLSMLQDTIDEIEHLARPGSTRADSLVSYDDDLPSPFLARMQPLVTDLRREISRLAELLDIHVRRRSRIRRLRALLTAELVRTDDSYSGKLRGYGKVDPRAGERIDPMLDRIRNGLVELLELSKASGEDETGPSRGNPS
jgi:hypothetical protein